MHKKLYPVAGASSLLNRYRPNAGLQLTSTCAPNGIVSLNHHAQHQRRTAGLNLSRGLSVKDDYGDPSAGNDPAAAAAVAALELYHRCNSFKFTQCVLYTPRVEFDDGSTLTHRPHLSKQVNFYDHTRVDTISTIVYIYVHIYIYIYNRE